MSLNDRQRRAMQLSGTVSFPPRFPEVAVISAVEGESMGRSLTSVVEFIRVEQVLTPKLTIGRVVAVGDVRALFVPLDCEAVDLQVGEWLLGNQVSAYLAQARSNSRQVNGILYVKEDAPIFMQVEVGMTAAESGEYYPPLGDDRALDHYQFATKHARCEP